MNDLPQPTPLRRFARSIWPALILATIVLLARGALIARHQSECYDDKHHLNVGIAFLRGDVGNRLQNDPPLGQAIGALPLYLTGSYNADPAIDMGLHGHRLSPETLQRLVGLWKSLLVVPMVAVVFLWARELYGLAAAWLATLLLLIEPTVAALAPLASVDLIGIEGIVVASYAVWRYLKSPTLVRALLASAAIAVAMLLKNTALILPGVAFVMAIAWWLVRPTLAGTLRDEWRGQAMRRSLHAAVAVVALPLVIWALVGFDVSKPLRRKKESLTGASVDVIRLLREPLPAGTYLRSVITGVEHTGRGHAAYLNGERRFAGRWDYFPTVATYKLPIGIGAVLLVGVASLAWRRPRFDEWSLAIPGAIYAGTLITTNINIGFRHFIPVVVFALMLATRAIAPRRAIASDQADPCGVGSSDERPAKRSDPAGVGVRIATFACVAIAFVETQRYAPNYLSFTNVARGAPWLKITDSNVDWGQSLPALRKWANAQTDGRPIAFAFFGTEDPNALAHHLAGTRVRVVLRTPYDRLPPGELPTAGLFVVSPVALTGTYDTTDPLAPLRAFEPVEVIDGALLVYDLDALPTPIVWPRRGDAP